MERMNPLKRSISLALLLSLSALLLIGATGCAALGYAAAVMPKPPIKASYEGLANQSIGVMVWVDRSIRIDYPTLQLDVANSIQLKLQAAQKDKKDELKAAIFPVEPRSIARYQADHPETDATPITEVAPNLNVSRVIYIEITDFATRPEASLELFRGEMMGAITVVAVDEAGRSKVVYEEKNVRVTFPPKSPPEGVPASNDVKIYTGTVDDFTTEIAQRFYTHDAPEE
jgi:hypothetical protein